MTVLWIEKRVPKAQSKKEAKFERQSFNLMTTEERMRRFISALQVKGIVIPHITVSFGRMLDPAYKGKFRHHKSIQLVKSIRVLCIAPPEDGKYLQIIGARAAHHAFMKQLFSELEFRDTESELLYALKRGKIRRIVIEEESVGKTGARVDKREFLVPRGAR